MLKRFCPLLGTILITFALIFWWWAMAMAFGAEMVGPYRLEARACRAKRCTVHVGRRTFGQFTCETLAERYRGRGLPARCIGTNRLDI